MNFDTRNIGNIRFSEGYNDDTSVPSIIRNDGQFICSRDDGDGWYYEWYDYMGEIIGLQWQGRSYVGAWIADETDLTESELAGRKNAGAKKMKKSYENIGAMIVDLGDAVKPVFQKYGFEGLPQCQIFTDEVMDFIKMMDEYGQLKSGYEASTKKSIATDSMSSYHSGFGLDDVSESDMKRKIDTMMAGLEYMDEPWKERLSRICDDWKAGKISTYECYNEISDIEYRQSVSVKDTKKMKKSNTNIHDMIAQCRKNNNSLIKEPVDLYGNWSESYFDVALFNGKKLIMRQSNYFSDDVIATYDGEVPDYQTPTGTNDLYALMTYNQDTGEINGKVRWGSYEKNYIPASGHSKSKGSLSVFINEFKEFVSDFTEMIELMK